MKNLRTFFALIILIAVIWIITGLVKNPSTIAPFSSAILAMIIPLFLGIWIAKRYKASWTIYGAGMATFIASQVLHIPFNQWVLNPIMKNAEIAPIPGSTGLILYSLILGLSAGIFEESARYITYVRFQKNARDWKDGLMLGAGHGGVEAMIIGAVLMYVFLQMIILKGLSEAALPSLVGPENVASTLITVDAYWSGAWYDKFLPLLERLSAMTFHLAASLLVLQAVRGKNSLWYFAAVGLHTATNAVALYVNLTYGAYIAEAAIFGFALFSFGIIYFLKKREPEPELEEEEAPIVSTIKPEPKPVKITKENLEDSRYD